jgi:hypothetical protein
MADSQAQFTSATDGPVVVHVVENMLRNTKRKRKSPPFFVVIGFLAIVMIVFLSFEKEYTDSSEGVSQKLSPASSSSHGEHVSQQHKHNDHLKQHKFDVNAPPVPSHSDDEDDDNDKSFIFWGRQANRLKQGDNTPYDYKTAKKRKKKKNKKQKAFPVIEDMDGALPQFKALGGAIIRAADTLMCRENVIDYVINATDLKDECDGLKKAFDKTCADDAEEGTGSQSRDDSSTGRRRLDAKGQQQQQQQTKRSNPVIAWQYYLHQVTRRFHHWVQPNHAVFMAEEEIVEAWEDARYDVEHDWDLVQALTENGAMTASRRLLDDEEPPKADEPAAVPITAVKNETTASVKEKPRMSLELPTKNQHASEKMLSGTLMLQHEDKIVASAVKVSLNHTNHTAAATTHKEDAAAAAAASAKAVADTAEFVSAILNDPASVEARTCCASILYVFHENCSVDEEDSVSDSRLFLVVAIIALCGLVKSLIRHFHLRWLPEAAGCILVGGTYPQIKRCLCILPVC